MKKVAIIGHFAFGKEYLDGQTVKTKNIAKELCKIYGEDQILCFDTHGGLKTLIKAPWISLKALRCARNVIMLPAHNGLRVFGRLLPLLKCFYKNRRIHYAVIGGWLPRKLEAEQRLAKKLRKFDSVFVETQTMMCALMEQDFDNVYIVPNFKDLTVLSPEDLVYYGKAPYKLCTFSRVTKKKGIETAVEAIRKANEQLGYAAYSLDVYGQIDPEQTEWFDNLQATYKNDMKYCGCVAADQSVETLKSYFALLFPTHYYTEGIPGTIIDAYASGIPVVAAKWESFCDVVDDGITGIGYEFDDASDLLEKLVAIGNNIDLVNGLKRNCLEKSRNYTPASAMKIITNNLL